MSGETEAQESGWTVDTLKYRVDDQIEAVRDSIRDLRTMLDERYATQTKATDKAFEAQQTAMQAALLAAEKAVDKARESDQKAVDKALESAEKAVTKAEVANEKRFESVNEFRGQLNDQATSFLTRTESAAQETRTTERLEDLAKASATHVTRTEADTVHKALMDRIELLSTQATMLDGKSKGITTGWLYLVGAVSTLGAVLTITVLVTGR